MKTILKLTDLTDPPLSGTMVLIDERADSINDGVFLMNMLEEEIDIGRTARKVLPVSPHLMHIRRVRFAGLHAMTWKHIVYVVKACALVGLVGCTNIATCDSVKREPTTQIDIFRDEAKPSRHYKEIGAVMDDGKLGQKASIEKRFIKQAKDIGGNALIMHPPIKSGVSGADDTYQFKGSIVVYE